MAWNDTMEMVWDLLFDSDSQGTMNRYHLLNNDFDSIGMACNCNPVFGQVCIIELGKDVEPLDWWEIKSYNWTWTEPTWVIDNIWEGEGYETGWDDECYPEMPDYLYCIYYKAEVRRALDDDTYVYPLPEFKMAFDSTCESERRDGFCGEITTEPILTGPFR